MFARLILIAAGVAIFTSGMAFSPDENTLYLTDADRVHAVWRAFDVKVDRQGNLFAAGPGGIYVLKPEGKHLGTFDLGGAGNCNWGDDGSSLYITSGKAVYRVRLKTKGAGF